MAPAPWAVSGGTPARAFDVLHLSSFNEGGLSLGMPGTSAHSWLHMALAKMNVASSQTSFSLPHWQAAVLHVHHWISFELALLIGPDVQLGRIQVRGGEVKHL